MTTPRADIDSPWKEILELYFPQAIQFFFPAVAELIDWDKPHEFLDTEFQKLVREAEQGKRFADKLVKVSTKQGTDLYLLLHLEVQAQRENPFEQRMFTYHFRIFDRFGQHPLSLALLCDASPNWRPNQYQFDQAGTRLTFDFTSVKLLDYRDRWDELEANSNPFAIVVMAQLRMLESKGNPEQRKAWKFSLIRMLYDRGYSRQDILNLYRFIDWVMVLPEGLDRAFWQELRQFEEEKKMSYVTKSCDNLKRKKR